MHEFPISRAPSSLRGKTATGDLRIHEFHSTIFGNTRFLRVWLPPEYEDEQDKTHHYPVLYLNDGQNLFESSTAFGGVEWQADETAERLIRNGSIPPMIIVGVDHAGQDRIREYMPYRSMQPVVLRALGKRYPNFLLKEVMPFVAERYRLASGAENTGLGGSSLGALISLYTAISHPGVIGRLLLESPSLWVSNRQLIRISRPVKRWPERIFLAMGTAEAATSEKSRSAVDDARELAAILSRAHLGEQRLRVMIEEGATHSESAWARRFPESLTFLFHRGEFGESADQGIPRFPGI